MLAVRADAREGCKFLPISCSAASQTRPWDRTWAFRLQFLLVVAGVRRAGVRAARHVGGRHRGERERDDELGLAAGIGSDGGVASAREGIAFVSQSSGVEEMGGGQPTGQ